MKISIITVVLNAVETIEDTLQSVLRQTYSDYEHIIVDGGSTDGTHDIIRKYEERYQGRLIWFSEKDNGLYDAMNKGISRSTGDIVGILNSDDFYTSDDVLSKVAEALESPQLDAVFADIHFISQGNNDKCIRYYSSRLFHPRWLRFGFMPAHPSFYARKQVYDEAGPYKTDYKIGADFEMMVRLFHRYKIRYAYIAQDFVTMRKGGLSNRNFKSTLQLIHEDVRGCKENGLYTNSLFICIKFLYKIFEFRL